MGSILIVDDDATLRHTLRDRVEFWGHAGFEASDGSSALECLDKREFDLVLLDLAMPGLSGQAVLEQLRQRGCSAEVIILTAHGSVDAAIRALKAGAADFLLKPADFDLLRTVIDRAMEQRSLRRHRNVIEERAGRVATFPPGGSAAMRGLLETAERAAHSNSTVLITGESGCGKQVLAEHLHRRSERASGPFVYVNCVALSDELIESTLFGHEKGAFTGAVCRKEGRLEAAGGGTAFLDEVGDITPRLQAKLLHFLETNEFERVGGSRTIRVDCRIIAATNRDLETAMREGRFRQDLYFRLNVIHLPVPPLRERREDIRPLVEAFVQHAAGELKRSPPSLHPDTLRILESYSWPGNVRQLRNAIERMVVLASEATLGPDLLPPEVFTAAPSDVGGRPSSESGASSPASLGEVRALKIATYQFRREYIRAALALVGGNQTRAAEVLGLQRTFLNRLIREYGL